MNKYYLLVHDGEIVWKRSGHSPAIYDSLEMAKNWRYYHTSYNHDDVKANILELILDGEDVIAATIVPDE